MNRNTQNAKMDKTEMLQQEQQKTEHLRRSNQTLSIHKLDSSYTSRHSTQIIT